MYDLVVTVERVVQEKFKVSVKADDPEEAQDIAFDFFSSYPNGTVPPETCLKISETTVTSEVRNVEFNRIADKVFNDDGNDCA